MLGHKKRASPIPKSIYHEQHKINEIMTNPCRLTDCPETRVRISWLAMTFQETLCLLLLSDHMALGDGFVWRCLPYVRLLLGNYPFPFWARSLWCIGILEISFSFGSVDQRDADAACVSLYLCICWIQAAHKTAANVLMYAQ